MTQHHCDHECNGTCCPVYSLAQTLYPKPQRGLPCNVSKCDNDTRSKTPAPAAPETFCPIISDKVKNCPDAATLRNQTLDELKKWNPFKQSFDDFVQSLRTQSTQERAP